MQRRFVSLWFQNLAINHFTRCNPGLKTLPCAIGCTINGRLMVLAINAAALSRGVKPGVTLADARALIPELHCFDDNPERDAALLAALADWCVRFTPFVAIDGSDGLFLDVTGCPHLFGGENRMLKDIVTRLIKLGFDVRGAMADTPGAAWAVARFATAGPIVPPGETKTALAGLPPASLRISPDTASTLTKLGFFKIAQLYDLPRPMLARRFGQEIIMCLEKALGGIKEHLIAKEQTPVYVARQEFIDTIATADAISHWTQQLMAQLCAQLDGDQQGAREVRLTSFRVDGFVEHLTVRTSVPSRRPDHLLRLFRDKLTTLTPGFGIELFILSAPQVEPLLAEQEKLIETPSDNCFTSLGELVDKLTNELGAGSVYGFQPVESHVPENSVWLAPPTEQTNKEWNTAKEWPIMLLRRPHQITVGMAQTPDYPPRTFTYNGKTHRIRKANGPDRIKPEWWEYGATEIRDYYRLEDDTGQKYWVYRLGHYGDKNMSWFLHGFFG